MKGGSELVMVIDLSGKELLRRCDRVVVRREEHAVVSDERRMDEKS